MPFTSPRKESSRHPVETGGRRSVVQSLRTLFWIARQKKDSFHHEGEPRLQTTQVFAEARDGRSRAYAVGRNRAPSKAARQLICKKNITELGTIIGVEGVELPLALQIVEVQDVAMGFRGNVDNAAGRSPRNQVEEQMSQ